MIRKQTRFVDPSVTSAHFPDYLKASAVLDALMDLAERISLQPDRPNAAIQSEFREIFGKAAWFPEEKAAEYFGNASRKAYRVDALIKVEDKDVHHNVPHPIQIKLSFFKKNSRGSYYDLTSYCREGGRIYWSTAIRAQPQPSGMREHTI